MSQEAMWWYKEHEQALEGLRSISALPHDSEGLSKTYIWLTRLAERERPQFKDLASRLAGHYALGETQWSDRAIAEMKARFNYFLAGMNIGLSAAATAKVKTLVGLFGLEQLMHEVNGKLIVMEIKQAS